MMPGDGGNRVHSDREKNIFKSYFNYVKLKAFHLKYYGR